MRLSRRRSRSSSRSSSSSRSRSRSGSPAAAGSGPSRSPSRSRSSSRSRSPSRSPRSAASRSVSSRSRSRSRSSSPRSARSSSRSRSRSGSRSRSSSRSGSESAGESAPPPAKLKVKIRKAPKSAGSDRNSSEDDHRDSEDEAAATTKRAKAKKASPTKTKKAKKAAAEEAAAADSDDSKEEFDDGLDEDLIGDDADRKKLEKMTEREREEELFKRAEIREEKRKRFEITKKLKLQQKLSGGKPRSSRDDEDDHEEGQVSDGDEDSFDFGQMLDAKERSQDRRKNMDALKFDKKSSALSELKAKKEEKERKEREKRERKDQEQENKENNREARKKKRERRDSASSGAGSDSGGSAAGRGRDSRSSSPASSRGSSVSSRASDSGGEESDTERISSKKKVQKYVETMEDLEPIRLSRHKMERFVHLPMFKRLITGCFVRIGIGQNQGRSVYRCCEITDVVETAKVYQLGKVRTNVGLKLKFGKQERVFRLEFISNTPFVASEFERWKDTVEKDNISVPTKDFVASKADEIKKALHYEYTSADVDAIIQRKERFNKNPHNYAMLKAKLMKDKEVALAEGNSEQATEIEGRLNDLEQRAEHLDKRRYERSSISAVSFINNRNRKNNVLKAELAIKEEMKRKEEEGVEDNPFTRRRCNPRMVTKKDEGPQVTQEMLRQLAEEQQRQQQQEQTEAADVPDSRPKEAPRPAASKNGGGGAEAEEPASKKAKLAPVASASAKSGNGKDDLFDAHDFDIEIDVDPVINIGGGGGGASSASAPVAPLKTFEARPPSAAGPNKRSLNLSDYKKKRGLI